MTESAGEAVDTRFLAQERILDALLRALALREPDLLSAVRGVLIDTEFGHAGKPGQSETVHQQIRKRLDGAADFARARGAHSAA